MHSYEEQIKFELEQWQRKMQRKPSLTNRLSKAIQGKVNSWIPDKVHHAITVAIQKMVELVQFGSKHLTSKPLLGATILYRESMVKQKIAFYRNTAVTEGAVTGAGGILFGLADFPLLLGIKLKLLFDIASLYGYDVKEYKERLYLLYVFQLAFSSQEHRNLTYSKLADWDAYSRDLPLDEKHFDWRTFQQEYRDYIDLAKMAQLVPFIGAAVGAIANYKLINKLGDTAMNCYRMRLESQKRIESS